MVHHLIRKAMEGIAPRGFCLGVEQELPRPTYRGSARRSTHTPLKPNSGLYEERVSRKSPPTWRKTASFLDGERLGLPPVSRSSYSTTGHGDTITEIALCVCALMDRCRQ